jgi:hypothetical protein
MAMDTVIDRDLQRSLLQRAKTPTKFNFHRRRHTKSTAPHLRNSGHFYTHTHTHTHTHTQCCMQHQHLITLLQNQIGKKSTKSLNIIKSLIQLLPPILEM